MWLYHLRNKLLWLLICSNCPMCAQSQQQMCDGSKCGMIWSFMQSDSVSKFIDISDFWLRPLKGGHAKVKWEWGEWYALGCPAKTSIFPGKAASSYAWRSLNLLLLSFGGYLPPRISPFWLQVCRRLVQSNSVSCWFLVIDSARNVWFSYK